jgi:hypothetical protein
MTRIRGKRALIIVSLAALAGTAGAQDLLRTSLNFYGTPGLIDMPSGEAAPDGALMVGVSNFAGISRTTLSFQIAPWIGGSFRYERIAGCDCLGFDTYYDRNFDVFVRVLEETRLLPSVTVGLQDFAGTGLNAAEYVVATKTVAPGLKVTAGLGWGRLGSYGGLGAPLGPRPRTDFGEGGKPNWNTWFRGDMAPFGGIEWQVNDKLGLKVEYSSDAYDFEAEDSGVFRRESPFNFGVEYQATPTVRLGAYYLYGTTVGVNAQVVLDPKRRAKDGRLVGGAALPVGIRPDPRVDPGAWSQDWVAQPERRDVLEMGLRQGLAKDGLVLEALALEGSRAQVRMRNPKYDAEAQAIGRAARRMSILLPASVEMFEIVTVSNGVATSKVTLRRSDLEALEFAPDGAAQVLARSRISEAGPLPPGGSVAEGAYPKFSWGLGPYARLSLFDPNDPVRVDVGARLAATWELAPGMVLSGAVTKKAFGNAGEARTSTSTLPHVRSDANLYNATEGVALERLTFAWTRDLGDGLYGRVTVGYLERMFGGVSAEVLWKPVDSKLGLGAEVNYVAQRDYDQRFGFQDYQVATGHMSAYYEFGDGYISQLDVGRYLAGDWGATLGIDREFANGWKVGAFATFTDVSAEEFGEGSFDKGIRLTIPSVWLTGEPSRATYSTTIRPLTRDGGARLSVQGRLYESVRSSHRDDLEAQWGRLFR